MESSPSSTPFFPLLMLLLIIQPDFVVYPTLGRTKEREREGTLMARASRADALAVKYSKLPGGREDLKADYDFEGGERRRLIPQLAKGRILVK